jgi:hypothetical protein
VQILEVCSLKGLLWPVHVLFCYVRGQMTWRFSFGFLGQLQGHRGLAASADDQAHLRSAQREARARAHPPFAHYQQIRSFLRASGVGLFVQRD